MNLSGTNVVVKRHLMQLRLELDISTLSNTVRRERADTYLLSDRSLMLGVYSCTCLTLDGQHGSQFSVQQFEAPLQIVLFLPVAS